MVVNLDEEKKKVRWGPATSEIRTICLQILREKTGRNATQRIGSDINRGIIGARRWGVFRGLYLDEIPHNLLRYKLGFD